MKFFTTLGNFLSDHLLAVLVWMILVNLALYALCGEDENRAAHKKSRYPFALLLVVALLGGALGGMIGTMRFAKKKQQKHRSVLWLILALLQEILLIFSICKAERPFLPSLSGVGSDFMAVFSWIHDVLGWARTPVPVILSVMSLISFIAFGIDKRKAVKSKRRIPEAALITLTVLFGAPGSLLAMLLFRHKTRHAKFTVTVGICLVLQLFLLAGILIG